MLRVPLESGSITLSRAGRTTVYPARFQLLMAANPCPCGNYGVPGRLCLCSARSVEMYWKKFSGPLLDRVDIRIPVVSQEEGESVSSEELRKKIAVAVLAQRTRQGKKNVHLSPQEILDFCPLDAASSVFLEGESNRRDFSQRAVSGCLKLARTIADLEGEKDIKLEHLKEAVSFRQDSGPLTVLEM